MPHRFEVFLSYNSADRTDVSSLASYLRDLGISVWFDQWMLIPGTAWQKALHEGISSSQTVAVCVGHSGVGPWENAEMMLALDRALKDSDYRVIPILLPSAPADNHIELPPFLNLYSWVDFRVGLNDPEATRRLIAGIKGNIPGPSQEPAASFSVNTTNSAPQQSLTASQNIDLDVLSRCLSVIGIPDDIQPELVSWLRTECDRYLDRSRIFDVSRSIPERLQRFGLPTPVIHDAESFLDEWVTSLTPPRLLSNAFYVSNEKITRTYRAYRSAIEAYFDAVGNPLESDAAEDKFLATYQYFAGTGNFVFLPARVLLGESLFWSADPVFYFVGAFMLDRKELFDAFPSVEVFLKEKSQRITLGLTNEVFGHSDPFHYPYVTMSGYLGQTSMRMRMSRKYVAVNSMTVDSLLTLIAGTPVIISGVGSIERSQDGGYLIQPTACRFSQSQSWLHPIERS